MAKTYQIPNDRRYLTPKRRRQKFIGLSKIKQPVRGLPLAKIIGKKRIN